jgi:hypothetical protein
MGNGGRRLNAPAPGLRDDKFNQSQKGSKKKREAFGGFGLVLVCFRGGH